MVLVRAAHEKSRNRYGAPRVQKELAEAQDVRVGRKRVARLMRQEGLRARPRRRFKVTMMSNHDQPVAGNVLGRKFEASAPNQKWVGDTTELVTGNGKLFLAVILDLFSRYVVGWALSPVNDRHLTMAALDMAIRHRCPDVGLLHHSDQGCTYASEDCQKLLQDHGIACSMSRRGEVLDNAVMESWNSTFLDGVRRTLPHARGREGRGVRVHRGVLQSAAASLGTWLREPGRVREGATVTFNGAAAPQRGDSMTRAIPPFRLIPEPLTEEARALPGFKWAAREAGTRHRLGGTPEFLQEDETPRCPDCKEQMVFYAQLDSINDEFCIADVGLLYVFVCFQCSTTFSLIQST